MCGINGVIGEFDKATGYDIVLRMNNAIIHRGPDDEGVFSENGFSFGMRRLSIVDLTKGHQPMWTENGIGIVYNGEIYNYRELRKDLEACGEKFTTDCDTEVFLLIYKKYGVEGIQKIEGMFGACIYDPLSASCYLFRDRLGIKPLYYGIKNNNFFFSSEIKGILAGIAEKPAINTKSLSHYLTLRYVPAPETMWDNILKLEPGYYLRYNFDVKKWETKKYWELNFLSGNLDNKRNYNTEFENLFKDSVEKHLVSSDVPVGVLLSGGLDSSAVSAAAMEMGHRNFYTFTVAFDEGGLYSELEYAKEVASYIGSNHHEVVIGRKEVKDFLPDMGYYMDEPIADLASIPLYYVSKLARQHVKVVLSGEGSDEIFAGYRIENIAKMVNLYSKYGKKLPKQLIKVASALLPQKYSSALNSINNHGEDQFLRNTHHNISYYWSDEEKEALLNQGMVRSTDALIESWYDTAYSHNPIDQLQQVYCKSWLVEDLLMKADKMSMANSLELRVPFLDHRIVEWAMMLPLEWKVGGSRTGYVSKRILREFCSGRIPESIIKRPKQGFLVPMVRWLDEEDFVNWSKELLYDNSFICSFLNRTSIEKTYEGVKLHIPNAANRIWLLIILEMWMKNWLH